MPFNDFLKLCTTLRSLYSKQVAQEVFEKNVGKFYNLGNFTKKTEKGALLFEEIAVN